MGMSALLESWNCRETREQMATISEGKTLSDSPSVYRHTLVVYLNNCELITHISDYNIAMTQFELAKICVTGVVDTCTREAFC